MKKSRNVALALGLALVAAAMLVLTACGSDRVTPVVPDPVVVRQQAPGPQDGSFTVQGVDGLSAPISDCWCTLAGDFSDFASTSCSYTASALANAMASCRGSLPSYEGTRTLTVSGNYCAVEGPGIRRITTSNSTLVVRPGGSATLRCNFR